MATMEDVRDFLKKAKIYHLATLEGDQPRVRPFGTAEIIDGRLYIQTGKKKDVFKQIMANPKVEIEACSGADWLRIETTLVNDDSVAAKKAMLDANPGLRKMYDENDANTAVLYMTKAKATLASLAKNKEGWTVEF